MRNEDSLIETRDYKSIEGYTLFRVPEFRWLDDPNRVIKEFQILLGQIS